MPIHLQILLLLEVYFKNYKNIKKPIKDLKNIFINIFIKYFKLLKMQKKISRNVFNHKKKVLCISFIEKKITKICKVKIYF